MAGRGHAALWVKLYELELQLRLMRAARGEEGARLRRTTTTRSVRARARRARAAAGSTMPTCAAATPGATRRVASPRRRRSGRRPGRGRARAAGGGGGGRLSPLALNCAAAQVKRSPPGCLLRPP